MTKDFTQSPAFKEYMRLQEESFARWSDFYAEGIKRNPFLGMLNKRREPLSPVPPCPLCGVDHLGGK